MPVKDQVKDSRDLTSEITFFPRCHSVSCSKTYAVFLCLSSESLRCVGDVAWIPKSWNLGHFEKFGKKNGLRILKLDYLGKFVVCVHCTYIKNDRLLKDRDMSVRDTSRKR